MSINWGNSNVKDVYWGNTPVKEVWYGSNKVWSRVITYYNKTINVEYSSPTIDDNIWVPSGNYEFTIKISEQNFIKFNLSITSDLTLNFNAFYHNDSQFNKVYRENFMLSNANPTSLEDYPIIIFSLVYTKYTSSGKIVYEHEVQTNTSYYTVSVLNDSISPQDAYTAHTYDILLQKI